MDDIWDEPATVVASNSRVQEPLFTYSDEEEAPRQAPKRPSKAARPPAKPTENMDDFAGDLFDDLIGADDTQPTPDINAILAKRAKAAEDVSKERGSKDTGKDATTTTKDDDDSKKKPTRTIAKVDEQRLLGDRGIPALIKEAKKFKPKGKGHESEDLDRLMSIYQFWAHNMFPKTQFRDTIDRVERVCRSRRMLINMSMWRDSGRAAEEPTRDPNKSASSDEEDEGATSTHQVPIDARVSRQSVPPSHPAPVQNMPIAMDDADLWDDVDDALIEMEANRIAQPSLPPVSRAQPSMPDDDDLEEWFNAGGDSGSLNTTNKAKPPDAMDVDDSPRRSAVSNPERFLSPPRADNWDEDLFA